MMFLRTITLIIVCILFTTTLLKAEDKTLSYVIIKPTFRDFNKIEVLAKNLTQVFFVNSDDAEKIGLNKAKLTDYLRLKVKNNFPNIKLEDSPRDKYKPEQIGYILFRVWIGGVEYPVVYHIKYEFWNLSLTRYRILEDEVLGCGTKGTVPDSVMKAIDRLTKRLAIVFSKARGKL